MAISRDEVSHVARLARLELTDAEIERFQEQLNVVLERAQRIQALDLDDIAPTAHPIELTNVLRPDEIVAPEPSDPILRNAPARDEQLFVVPPVLEEEE